ncbi:MAG: helix-turn-helix domain-containing protein [Alphaproteobacteria bacterium]|nr:helix-turn-helix domain-containing protein [Alphaproteobacteria bacterium]
MDTAVPISTGDKLCAPECLPESCRNCSVRHLAICAALNTTEMVELSGIASFQELQNHDPITSEGEVADSVFNVTAGAVELYKLLPDGRRQVTGFLFPGDFLGIAMNERYSYSSEAVGNTRLCRFPRKKLEAMLDRMPQLERRLLSMASNELIQAQDQMLLLGRKTAKEKLCSFLLNLSKRAASRGEDPSVVHVPMSRSDIGDYLGLTTETVSRNFTQLKTKGVIRLLEGGMVHLPDLERVRELAEEA